MRLAWFSPLPPSRSGIAAYSLALLSALGQRHAIDAFVEPPSRSGPDDPARPARPGGPIGAVDGATVFDAHDFVWRHARQPYHLPVYQLGNDLSHDYMWPYMVRHPGLVVLHDGQLHQARAKALTWKRRRLDDYRAEFAYAHPDAPAGIADLVVAGLGGMLFQLWPMLRVPVEAARVAVVHSARFASDLRGEFPGRRICLARPGMPDISETARATPAEVKVRHGIPAGAVVFAAYGRVTPEKRLAEAVEALAGVAVVGTPPHLLLVGETVDYYDVVGTARSVGLADRVTVTGYVADEQLGEYLAAADVCICLRWPTSRETSASWLRCIAAGKPTIVTDLVHNADVPVLDPRQMRTLQVPPGGRQTGAPLGMAVSLDDEIATLQLSMQRLAEDADLRARLGGAARAYWEREATVDRWVRDYEAAIAAAVAAPYSPPPAWPDHLRADGTALAREIASGFGIGLDWL